MINDDDLFLQGTYRCHVIGIRATYTAKNNEDKLIILEKSLHFQKTIRVFEGSQSLGEISLKGYHTL